MDSSDSSEESSPPLLWLSSLCMSHPANTIVLRHPVLAVCASHICAGCTNVRSCTDAEGLKRREELQRTIQTKTDTTRPPISRAHFFFITSCLLLLVKDTLTCNVMTITLNIIIMVQVFIIIEQVCESRCMTVLDRKRCVINSWLSSTF